MFMKKMICSIMGAAMILGAATTSFAASPDTQSVTEPERIVYSDGSVLLIETDVLPRSARSDGYSASKKASYKYGGRTVWTYSIHATFSLTGRATGIGDSYSISDDAWSFDGSTKSKSGNTATGDATFSTSRASKDISLSLTCDSEGNIE